MTNREEILKETDVVDELSFEHVDKRYVRVVMINTAAVYVLALMIPLLLFLIDDFKDYTAILSLAVVIVLSGSVNVVFAGKACRYMGYALREKDISFRSGLFFHKVVSVPYCKIQQVCVSQSPLARLFNLYSVEVSNGSAWQSSIVIPGLVKRRAELLKQHITNKLGDAAK